MHGKNFESQKFSKKKLFFLKKSLSKNFPKKFEKGINFDSSIPVQ